MKFRYNYLLIIIALLFGITACGTPEITPSAATKTNKTFALEQLYWGHSSTIPPNMSIEQYKKTVNNYLNSNLYQQQNLLYHTALRASTWQEIDLEAKKFLEQAHTSEAAFLIETEVAASLLRSVFINQNNDKEAIQAIDRYMSILERRNYYSEPNLYLQILPKLKGFWSNEKIANVAKNCLKANLRTNSATQTNFSTAQNYFQNQAQKEITQNVNFQQSKFNVVSPEVIYRANELKEKYKQAIPEKLNQIKSKLAKQDDWFKTSTDALIILSLMAE